MLHDFGQILASATRNSEMGSLNVEMARAQVSELIETLRALNSNIVKEKQNLSREKD